MIGDMFVKKFVYIEKITISDGTLDTYKLIKFILCKTLKILTFSFNFSCFITYVTIVVYLFVQEQLKKRECDDFIIYETYLQKK